MIGLRGEDRVHSGRRLIQADQNHNVASLTAGEERARYRYSDAAALFLAASNRQA